MVTHFSHGLGQLVNASAAEARVLRSSLAYLTILKCGATKKKCAFYLFACPLPPPMGEHRTAKPFERERAASFFVLGSPLLVLRWWEGKRAGWGSAHRGAISSSFLKPSACPLGIARCHHHHYHLRTAKEHLSGEGPDINSFFRSASTCLRGRLSLSLRKSGAF